jgi:hypothetical protein
MAALNLLIELKEWAFNHAWVLSISTLVLIQFFAIQAFLVHYHLFRKSLQKPKPDSLRFAQIEKSIAFQSEQIEKLFDKIAETRKEILDLTPMTKARGAPEPKTHSFESSFLSLGEINLKRRLESFQKNI